MNRRNLLKSSILGGIGAVSATLDQLKRII